MAQKFQLKPKRVVSLIASSTEIIHALGCGEWMVGRSHECDYPPSVTRLPKVTEPKFRLDGSSYEIDQRLKAILQEGLGVYRVDAEALNALRPEVIVTQVQCEVCAVSLKDLEGAVCEVIESKPEIVALNPNALSDLWEDVRKVARALGVSARGDELIAELTGRLSAISRRTQSLAKPRVAYIEWIEPLMTGGQLDARVN